jgi:hypothetical protein
MVYTINRKKDRKMTVSKTSARKPPATKPVTAKKAAETKPTTAKKLPVTKPAAKTSSAAPSAKSIKIVSKDAKPKEVKPKKVKLIRDSFTMPSFDYDLIDVLKAKALGSKAAIKKSELLRAGLHALNKLDAAQLIALVGTLEIVKTGRPKK